MAKNSETVTSAICSSSSVNKAEPSHLGRVLRIRSVEPLLNGGDVEAALVLITRLEAKLRPLRDDIYAALAVPH